PGLGLRDRPRLFDADGVADGEFVRLVVRVILLRAADDLPVQRVLHLALDEHGHGLVGLVGNDGPDQDTLGHRLVPYFASAGCALLARWPCSVLMRAISRRTSLIRAGRSSWL